MHMIPTSNQVLQLRNLSKNADSKTDIKCVHKIGIKQADDSIQDMVHSRVSGGDIDYLTVLVVDMEHTLMGYGDIQYITELEMVVWDTHQCMYIGE